MKQPRTQVRFLTSSAQATALKRIARERGISRDALLRDLVAASTGEPNTFRRVPAKREPFNGFAAYNAKRAAN